VSGGEVSNEKGGWGCKGSGSGKPEDQNTR